MNNYALLSKVHTGGRCVRSLFGVLMGVAVVLFFVHTQPLQAVVTCYDISGNIVGNCGFETGVAGPWTTSGNVSITTNSPNTLAYSTQGGSYSITQNLNTVANAEYTISFWLAPVNNPTVTIAFGSTPLPFTLQGPGYSEYTYTNVVASGNLTSLYFDVKSTSKLDQAFIDDVSVVCTARCGDVLIPEPATWLTMGSIVAFSVMMRSARRRST